MIDIGPNLTDVLKGGFICMAVAVAAWSFFKYGVRYML